MSLNDIAPVHIKYRADIDGLRAIAVLLVVLYHAFPNYLEGGFVGVDVFFVISGYLISTIIFDGIERGKYNVIEFYKRRIKRIFPALSLVLTCCLVFGWITLLDDEYKQLGKNVAAGVAFISNYILWGESGYFDNIAETKPLLHLWSLGIEEQFYIFWPLLVWAANKVKNSWLVLILTAAVISFILNIIKVQYDPVATFYSPQTRAWELLLGALLAYFEKRNLRKISGSNTRNFASLIGLIFLILGVCFTKKESPFPGYLALLPTLGTWLLIYAGTQAWINKNILSKKFLVWIGLISFPVYLWHWPLLSFFRILVGQEASVEWRLILVTLSFILAWGTYKYIERPLRTAKNEPRVLAVLLVLMIFIGVFGYSIYRNDGFAFRLKDRQTYAEYFENSLPALKFSEKNDLFRTYKHECDFYDFSSYRRGAATQIPRIAIDENCYKRDPKKKKVLFMWGDSHVQQLYFGLNNSLPNDWQILIVASSGCPASLDIEGDPGKNYCLKSNRFALTEMRKSKPDIVIIGQNLNHSIESMKSLGSYLKILGIKRIIFTGPTPHWTTELPKIVMKYLWFYTPERTKLFLNQDIVSSNSKMKESLNGSEDFIYADIMSAFCDNSGCLVYLDGDRRAGITTWDHGHLTPKASNFLAKKMLVDLITK